MNQNNSAVSKSILRRPGVRSLCLDISADLRDGLDRLKAKEGRTLRTIVERALRKVVKP